jgi:hypothetical protein
MAMRSFALLSVLFLALFLMIALHYRSFDHGRHTAKIERFSQLTGLPGLAFSKAYFETRRTAYGAPALNSYVELPMIDRMDYLYAQ